MHIKHCGNAALELKARTFEILGQLRRSRIRLDTLTFLARIFPEAASISEIARGTGHSATDISGGIRGQKKRYLGENSLLNQNLIEYVQVDNRKYFRITSTGISIVKVFSERLNRQSMVSFGAFPGEVTHFS